MTDPDRKVLRAGTDEGPASTQVATPWSCVKHRAAGSHGSCTQCEREKADAGKTADAQLDCARRWGPFDEDRSHAHYCKHGEGHNGAHVCWCGSVMVGERPAVESSDVGPDGEPTMSATRSRESGNRPASRGRPSADTDGARDPDVVTPLSPSGVDAGTSVPRAKRQPLRNRSYERAVERATERLKREGVATIERRQVAAGVEAALDGMTGAMTRLAHYEANEDVEPADSARTEADVEAAARRIREIPWCTRTMATNADHIARAVFDLPEPPLSPESQAILDRAARAADGTGAGA